ncbi:hypothetical protein TWF594_009272 [Orbilia oligospora]|nr:hypothetical protein TWF594_009272 [Orbilia oligospora]
MFVVCTRRIGGGERAGTYITSQTELKKALPQMEIIPNATPTMPTKIECGRANGWKWLCRINPSECEEGSSSTARSPAAHHSCGKKINLYDDNAHAHVTCCLRSLSLYWSKNRDTISLFFLV